MGKMLEMVQTERILDIKSGNCRYDKNGKEE